ncbi:MAG: glycine--tRNA ligase, partial [Methermicoccaceae archaeon]
MDAYERVIELAKRRGFIWSSLELYGGVAGLYDYGPLGAALKHNMESLWRRMYCTEEGFYEIESSILGVEDVFLASGHL